MNIFSKYKKVWLVIGFIAITIAIGFLLYKMFFQISPQIVTEVTPVETGVGGLPQAGEGGAQQTTDGDGQFPGSGNITTTETGTITNDQPDPNKPSNLANGGLTDTKAIVSSSSLSPSLNSNGDVQYYNREDGYFYRINNNGDIEKMSDRVFYSVDKVTWAPDNNKAILEYPDGSKILYDFETKKQISYPKHWEDFSFSPQSDQVIAKSIALDPDNRFLTVAGTDGSAARNIEEIGTNADKVITGWSPNNQIVATYTKSLDFDRQEVFFVGLNGENFKSTIVEGRGLTYEWSKTGDRLLYSAYNTRSDLKPKLWIVDASGDTINQNRRSLEINTWADKCTFASNTEIYCAVPTSLESGSGIFREIASNASDEIYKIDLETGNTKLVAIPNGSFNVKEIMVDDGQNSLTFSDQNSGAIYQIKLK
ncbi:MAG: hypothetical protein WAW11_00610 [Patescibacteria group bacterium]